MGAGAKKRNRDSRLVEKRKKKAANKALYESRKKSGENTKSSRAVKSARKKKTNALKGTHPQGRCGNPACKRCFEHTETGVYQKKFV